MVLGYFYDIEHDHGQKNSSTRMKKIAKIRSQPAKYNVFCRTEASRIINSVRAISYEWFFQTLPFICHSFQYRSCGLWMGRRWDGIFLIRPTV